MEQLASPAKSAKGWGEPVHEAEPMYTFKTPFEVLTHVPMALKEEVI